MKLKFKILIPVWGEEYQELFCYAGLLSLLAQGNIPELAQNGDLKVCFLTTKASVGFFLKNVDFQTLKKLAEVTFTFIDDLVDIRNYGYVLTLAYERGITEETPEAQLNTFFIFLNADFVLSNNAFTTLLKHIRNGKNGIVSPSLRCNKENVFWRLRARYQDMNKHAPSSRELMRFALEYLHPTVLAKIINQNLLRAHWINQFYWKVDDNILLGRFFLMFMFCIKPETLLKEASNYCDYSFVPDLCPTGNYSIIKDSDELFILELSNKHQECDLLHLGHPLPPMDIARELSIWTTPHHRLYSKETLVFHAESTTDVMTDGIKRLDSFMNNIYSLLGPEVSHINHPFWTTAISSFQNEQDDRASLNQAQSVDVLRKIFKKIRELFLGYTPYVKRWHPDWLDYSTAISLLKDSEIEDENHVLYIADCINPFDIVFKGAKIGLKSFLMKSESKVGLEKIKKMFFGDCVRVIKT